MRVRVADTGYIVVHIDIPFTGVIKQVYTFSTYDIDWFTIE
jgi:hypothetical protein